ncbi:hypothetical protein K1719_036199 [Acacia pycnantha]|nr:hypothetical protein K1719_036199 [Acacia pycnantha]
MAVIGKNFNTKSERRKNRETLESIYQLKKRQRLREAEKTGRSNCPAQVKQEGGEGMELETEKLRLRDVLEFQNDPFVGRSHRPNREILMDLGTSKSSSESSDGFNIYITRPTNRKVKDPSVPVGTFLAQINGANNSTLSLPYLKNNKLDFSSMSNLPQVQALMEAYAPMIGEESSKSVAIDPSGSNLPQGGENNGAYWIDLPQDETNKDRVKRGDLQSFQAYLHIKPMFGATFIDISTWIFYPFNGPSRARVVVINSIPLGKIAEHTAEANGEWGPKISYTIEEELDKVEKVLPMNVRSGFEKFRHSLPNELFKEDGPTGPKLKSSWYGDER